MWSDARTGHVCDYCLKPIGAFWVQVVAFRHEDDETEQRNVAVVCNFSCARLRAEELELEGEVPQ